VPPVSCPDIDSIFEHQVSNIEGSLGISVASIFRTQKTRKTRMNTEKSLVKMPFPCVSVNSVCHLHCAQAQVSVYGFSR